MTRKMKDSGIEWCTSIPNEWHVARGRNILTLLERPVKDDDGVITCFRDGEVTLRSKRREDGFTISMQEIGYQGIEPGDLVVHGMDGFAGAIGIADSRGKATPVLNVLDSSQNKRYLMYYLRCCAFNGVFYALSTGIRVRSCDTNWNKIRDLLYVIPPIHEQGRIAEYLDVKCASIDNVITKTNESIEEYKKLKQAVITEAVTKGVRGNRHMKKSGIEWVDSIPVDWDVVKIKRVMYDVNQQSALKEEQLSVTQDRGIIKSSEAKIANPSVNTEGWKLVMPNDIVFNKYKAHSGVFFVSPFRGIVTFNYNVYRCYKGIHPSFLEYLYKTSGCISEFIKSMKGVGESISPLYTKDLSLIEIPLPSYEEQKEITSHIDSKCAAIDTLISKKQQFIDELTAYKKSLIYEYVTGKKEVPA